MSAIGTVALLVLCAIPAWAQKKKVVWYDPVVVADKTYGCLHPRVVLDRVDHHMVLWGDVHGKAFLTKWDGRAFLEPEQMNTPGASVFTESWAGPEIAARGDTMYLVYKQMPEDNGKVMIRHSYDGGSSWSVEETVEDSNTVLTRFPTVAMDPDGNPLVTFLHFQAGYTNPEYVVAKSTDLGDSFSHYAIVSNYSGSAVSDCGPATVVESGNATVAVYRDNTHSHRNVWAGISTNHAGSFTKGLQVDYTNWSSNLCEPEPPHAVIIGDTVYTVYASGGDSSLIYLSRTSLSGAVTSSAPLTTYFPGLVGQRFPRIANLGNTTAIAWQQSVGARTQVCMAFANDITSDAITGYDTMWFGSPVMPDVVVGNGHVYMVWQDDSAHRVMCRTGRYEQTVTNRLLSENTTIALITAKSGKYFTVSLPDISSVLLIDNEGKEYEMDIKCKKSICKVNIEDMDPGVYIVRIFDRNDKVYNYKYEVKPIPEKPEKKER